MFWYKKGYIKKGYILIYTLLFGIMIVMILMFSLRLELFRKEKGGLVKKDILDKYYNKECTDCLFSDMNNYICNNCSALSNDSVKTFLSSSENGCRIGANDYYLFYDKVSNRFSLRICYDEKTYRDNIYTYQVNNGKIQFNYLKTIYNLRG